MVVAVAEASKSGLGSQVAAKLALENFERSTLESFAAPPSDSPLKPVPASQLTLNLGTPTGYSVQVLEEAFRQANRGVYEFGHKLSAGGRLAASLLGFVVRDDSIAAGRVGSAGLLLIREGEVHSFFHGESESGPASVGRENLIGSNSLVNVELSSIPIQERDIVVLLPRALSGAEEGDLLNLLLAERNNPNVAQLIGKKLFPLDRSASLLLVAEIGPRAIYLGQEVQVLS